MPSSDADELKSGYIGRYRVEKLIGRGGFGLVYLAFDEELRRPVAIKVPYRDRVSVSDDVESYRTEARAVANFDHPHIVPVYDVGSTDEHPIFIVSKYIEGCTLAAKTEEYRPSIAAAADLVATVADALDYAHRRGLVHRDVKPGNILIDAEGKAFVVDFGLALKEENLGQGPRHVGTTAYMSPEQARGEGHRVDRRSDIFSLGVIFHELLVGRRPFEAETRVKLLEKIIRYEAPSVRDVDKHIPKELDRICSQAMKKRASDRYGTAKEMAEDIKCWATTFEGSHAHSETEWRQLGPVTDPLPVSTNAHVEPVLIAPAVVAPSSESQFVKIVPKGLRSFDAYDADFFLELVPGPRDRFGMPQSIRFWKIRLEESDSDNTCPVGLIYGPSGCGKSSLVKAGLLPRLSSDVTTIYVEATAEETESRILNGLHKRCPELAKNASLRELMAAIRRGRRNSTDKTKVVLILDQFEQWLHAKKEERNTELVEALRQCDGGRLQCIIMVRDDFWLAVSRFLEDLEVRLVEGQNSALIDLFDLDHGRKVLAAFGRAYGKIAELHRDESPDQKEFLHQAVAGLAQEGKVISVRLALFAEMMKAKSWTPAALKEVGGTEGVGVTFLEEAFTATNAPHEHRYHEKAARKVLMALLPESGSDIKGHMRSKSDLLVASGYSNRSENFDTLIRILDTEIRLITPTDPDGNNEGSTQLRKTGEQFYQLTHDYLVPSLRDWLTRKQKETRRGRAELLLADRAAVWNSRIENRQLPTVSQWLKIRWLVGKHTWTLSQRKMMEAAGRYHAARGIVVGLFLAIITFVGLKIQNNLVEERNQTHAAGLVNGLLTAEVAESESILKSMESYRQWVNPLLLQANDQAAPNSREKLLVSLALLPDEAQVDYLCERLLSAEPKEVKVICDALAFRKEKLTDGLWDVYARPTYEHDPRILRAAAALAQYSPNDERWKKNRDQVTEQLVGVSPFFVQYWIDLLRPVKAQLIPRLTAIFKMAQGDDSQRLVVAQILADFANDQPQDLAELMMYADEKQFAAIFPRLKDRFEQAAPRLTAELAKTSSDDAEDQAKETLAKRKANAAVALVKLHQVEEVWPLIRQLLKHGPDPRTRSYLIHRFSGLGVAPEIIVQRLENEADTTIRRALLLCIGEYGEKTVPPELSTALLPKLYELYLNSDPGIHSATEWLLCQLEQQAWVKQTNEKWKLSKELRDKQFDVIQRTLERDKESAARQWYVNGQGQTMVIFPGPIIYTMGSPTTELSRENNEHQHQVRIGRTFAVGNKPVTVEQYREFEKDFPLAAIFERMPDLPVAGIDWYRAAKYCNWLSEFEGVSNDQWCYEVVNGEFRLKANYLSLGGYRLPTEAELEYATRAEARTARYYGETDELIMKYAWCQQNSAQMTWPVGSLKPNDFGLFDAHGNVWSWCQEDFKDYPTDGKLHDDVECGLVIVDAENRGLRGGAFNFPSPYIRSSYRTLNVPTANLNRYGFRVARTLSAIVPTSTLPERHK